MSNIRTSESRVRALRSTVDGIGPEVAEHLQQMGVDPRDHAASIRAARFQRSALGATRAPARAASGRALPPPPQGATPLSLDPSDVTQRTLLSEVALESMEDVFIQDEVAPVQLVGVRSGRVYVTSRTANRAEVDDNLGERGRAARIPSGLSYFDYDCQAYGLESDVNEQLAGEHPLLENVSAETRRVGTAVYLQQELRVVRGKLFAAGSYNGSNVQALADTFQWNGGSAANPIANLHTAIAAMIAPPTHMIMCLEVFQSAVQQNDDLRAILADAHAGLISADEFGMYFGVPRVIVNRGDYAAAATPTVMSRILSMTDIAIIHTNASPKARSFMRQVRLRQGAQGLVTTTRFDGAPGVGGFTLPKVAHQTHCVVIDSQYGALIQNARRVA